MTRNLLDVVLCWHMHQPCYVVDDTFQRPWVYLHALKDYSDMAAHLESQPRARAVVNFVPALLEQLERYASAVTHVSDPAQLPDSLLAALAANDHPKAPEERAAILSVCIAALHERATQRFSQYASLLELARVASRPEHAAYVSDALLDDLIVWTHLVWLGEHDHRADVQVKELVLRGRGFDKASRLRLFALVSERLQKIIPRYRQLARSGRIELAVSPWAHPLLPLLIDMNAARDALPDASLPEPPHYPGGTTRARWHVAESIATMQRCFGVRPRGCWPPEAAVSSATLALLGELGFEWAASAGAVLTGSLQAGHQRVDCVHRPFAHGGVQTFFRDDGLSDLIGFTYKTWPATDAVDDLVGHLERIARHCERPDAIVTIALDGENAWEHYPENAYDFLDTLYRRLSSTPGIRLTTFSEHLDRRHAPAKLDRVRAGSWVYGTLATWIGHPEKNRAWELLIAAKQRFDVHGAAPHTLERLLGVCEGSDWFWWLGDDNATAAVESFDRLFRAHLTAFYRALGESPPAALEVPLSHGSPRAIAHTMRPTEPQ